MTKPIGIDLGTTNSAIAVLDEFGKPEIVPSPSDGARITPSYVAFPPDDETLVLVGGEAKEELGHRPESVIQGVKRDMGTDEEYSMRGDTYTPQQISSFILKKLVEGTSKIHGPIDSAIITVPANFSEASRRATMQAGEIAGFRVAHIINEPTAAALAYATSGNALSGTLMIYDLGGGTFDVTIARLNGKEVEAITSQGDSRLGGADFDRRLYEIIRAQFETETGLSLPSEPDREGHYNSYLEKAEKMKQDLSRRQTARNTLYHDEAGSCRLEVSRTDFEEKISNLISKTEMLVETALDDADMKPSDIDHILLVGGSTRIPAVRESIQRVMGREPLDTVNPDEAVALGASIYAGLKSDSLSAVQRQQMQDIKMSDVANHYYGTIAVEHDEVRQSAERRVSVIIPKDSPIPAEGSETFHTIHDGQTNVRVRITQSAEEVDDPQFVNIVYEGDFELPPGRPAGQAIQVTYRYDENQTMHCEFLDVASGRTHRTDLQLDSLGSTETQSASIEDFVVE